MSFFGQEPTRNEQINVGTTSVIVSEARNELNPRKDILIRNTSANVADVITIVIGFTTATDNNGIVLKMNESVSFSNETGYTMPQGTISAICATANGKLSIFER
jgi:hypothetical protein